jgi:hypothetical protein
MQRRVLALALLGALVGAGLQLEGQPAASTLSVGGRAGAVVVGDLNHDGHADIVAARLDAGTVSVFLGDGRGRFAPANGTPFAAGQSPEDLALADFDEDGRLDLAVANHETTYVTVLLGNGTGGLSPAPVPRLAVASRPHPHGVAAGDFNGDRHVDLAIESWQENTVLAFWGTGTAAFATSPARLAVGNQPYWKLRSGDFNGDNTSDLVVTNTGGAGVSVVCSDARGGLAPARDIATARAPFAVATGDVDGDRILDLAVAHRSGGSDRSLDGLTVLRGKGDCSFDAVPTPSLRIGTSPTAVAIDDVNGDGIGDIAVADMDSDDVTILPGARASAGSRPSYSVRVGRGPQAIALADVDGDRKADIVTGNWGSGDLTIVPGR